MKSIVTWKVKILCALLFATLMTGCYDGGGWGGGYPGYWGGGSPAYYSNGFYSNDYYRGYGRDPDRGLFGGYPPARDAWDASSRGRTSYGGSHYGGYGG